MDLTRTFLVDQNSFWRVHWPPSDIASVPSNITTTPNSPAKKHTALISPSTAVALLAFFRCDLWQLAGTLPTPDIVHVHHLRHLLAFQAQIHWRKKVPTGPHPSWDFARW
jgi:hypothetical protein